MKHTKAKRTTIEKLVGKKCKEIRVPKYTIKINQNAKRLKEKLTASYPGNIVDKGQIQQVQEKFSLECKEVHLKNIIKAIEELSATPDSQTLRINKCSEQLNSKTEVFYNSPTLILRSIKFCILRRNWDNLTHLLLLLLHQKSFYLPFIQNICQLIGKFNPLAREDDLKGQFQLLTAKVEEELIK